MLSNLKDLETKGFVVLKNFFSESDISMLLDIYVDTKQRIAKDGFSNPRYKIATVGSPTVINDKIESFLATVSANTNLTINSSQKTVTFYDTEFVNWKWHQDLEPYLLFQDPYNSINFWFPLVKPSAKDSGLSLVPMDKLLDADRGTTAARIITKGGQGFWVNDRSTTEVKDHFNGGQYTIDANIDELFETPEVSPGDAIAFRYDVIHKTQPGAQSDRIAASIRCYNKDGDISLEHIISPGGAEKNDSVTRFDIFRVIKKLFQLKKTDTLKIKDIVDILDKRVS